MDAIESLVEKGDFQQSTQEKTPFTFQVKLLFSRIKVQKKQCWYLRKVPDSVQFNAPKIDDHVIEKSFIALYNRNIFIL